MTETEDSLCLKDVLILVVEDDWDRQVGLTRILTRAGAEVTIVDELDDSEREAVTAAESGAPYQVVLFSVAMAPDGPDACDEYMGKLRAAGVRQPIIGMVSRDAGGSTNLGSGKFDRTLTWPMEGKKLLNLICGSLPS